MCRPTFLLLGLWLCMVLLLQFRPVQDVDTFWQVRLGQLMLQSGRLVNQEPFTYTHGGEPVPVVGWLAQVIFASLYQVGSWRAVQLLHALLFAGAFVLTAWPACKEANLFALAAGVVLGFLAGLSNSDVRPQSFALCGLALLLWLARSEVRVGSKLFLALPLLLVWQNCHASVVIGAVAVAALAGAETVRYLRRRACGKVLPLLGLLGVVSASQFATPLGWNMVAINRHILEVSRDWVRASEWLPPWAPEVRGATLPFWVALGFSLALLIKLKCRVDLADLSLFLVMTVLAFGAARLVLFWGVAMVPVWARWIERAKSPNLFGWRAGGLVRLRIALPALAAAAGIAFATPPALGAPFMSPEIPAEGINRLKAALPAGAIYNYREWGGPLILAAPPGWKVAIDGRLSLFSKDEWSDYNNVARGTISLQEVVRRHRPDAFFLRRSFHGPLIQRLQQSPAWRELYVDDTCSVFIKQGSLIEGATP